MAIGARELSKLRKSACARQGAAAQTRRTLAAGLGGEIR
jgi:hypothetical protein